VVLALCGTDELEYVVCFRVSTSITHPLNVVGEPKCFNTEELFAASLERIFSFCRIHGRDQVGEFSEVRMIANGNIDHSCVVFKGEAGICVLHYLYVLFCKSWRLTVELESYSRGTQSTDLHIIIV
jgi:hypothetical protein